MSNNEAFNFDEKARDTVKRAKLVFFRLSQL